MTGRVDAIYTVDMEMILTTEGKLVDGTNVDRVWSEAQGRMIKPFVRVTVSRVDVFGELDMWAIVDPRLTNDRFLGTSVEDVVLLAMRPEVVCEIWPCVTVHVV